jgi:choice-of-anchor B domain-containing protein
MKPALCIALLAWSFSALAQPDSLELIYQWDDPSIEASEIGQNRYNEVFGFVVDGDEYAVIGSTKGAHIFSLTDGEEKEVAFVEGSASGREVIHRDFDVYQNYLYMVADQGAQGTLQIIDLSGLPEKVELVYDTSEYIIRSHNIFIDKAGKRMYSCGGALSGVAPGLDKPNDLSIYSLEDPRRPTLIFDCREQLGIWQNIGYIHDIFVRGDTAYCNAGNKGMFVVDFSSLNNVKLLGSMREYDHKGYNHQGYLHPSKPYYVMTDETHGLDLKLVDVSDLKDMEIIDRFNSGVSAEFSVPHNALFKGDYIYVSYYYDGVYVFDASDPANVEARFFYDTNEDEPTNDFNGCWGVYPFLPSGKILASDMINGLFVFWNPFEPHPQEVELRELTLKSNLVTDQLVIDHQWLGETVDMRVISVRGDEVLRSTLKEGENVITLSSIGSGWYSITLQSEKEVKYFRFYKI